MSALTDLTITEARDQLRAKKISARELAQAHVSAIAKAKELNAFITETPEIERSGCSRPVPTTRPPWP